MVAGVAGGLADRWGVPAWLVRLPFGFAAFLDGLIVWNAFDDENAFEPGIFGVRPRFAALAIGLTLIYLALWVFVPSAEVGTSAASRSMRRFAVAPIRRMRERYPGLRSWPGLLLLAIGGALLADQLGIWNPNVAFAFALIALGIVVYRRPSSAVTPVTGSTVGDAPPPTPTGDPSVTAPVVPRSRHERSPLGWISFGLALLAVCVAGIAMQSRIANGSAPYGSARALFDRVATVPAIGVLVLGIGMVVGSVVGRARWLVAPALLLSAAMLLGSVIRLPLEGRFGDTALYVRSDSQLGQSYSSAAGKYFLDLTKYVGRGDIRRWSISATTAFGDVQIVLPYDASYRVTGYTGLGSLSIAPCAGGSDDGIEVAARAKVRSEVRGGPSFVIHVESGIGDVWVGKSASSHREARLAREARCETTPV